MATVVDTCRTLITPKLQAAGLEREPFSIAGQYTFTDALLPALLDRALKGDL